MALDLNSYFIAEVSLILILLFVLSQLLHLFDVKGSVVAVIVGAIISFTGGIEWLILLIVFASVSQVATKIGFKRKLAKQEQEGTIGERKVSNVVYGGAIGVIIAILSVVIPYKFPYFVLFAAAFAAIASDTFASEIGLLDDKTYLITNFKRCKTGTNGGISVTGTLASLLGSALIALTYYILTHGRNGDIAFTSIVVITGFLASQFDSILGAVYENRGKLNKGAVNLLASLFAVILSFVVLVL